MRISIRPYMGVPHIKKERKVAMNITRTAGGGGNSPRESHAGSLDARTAGQRLVNQWLASLGTAQERSQPVAYVFVMGNAIEILRTFGFEIAFPEINSLQSGVRKSAPDFIAKAEDFGFSPDVCSYVKADVGLILSNMQHPSGVQMPLPDLA